MQTQILDKLRKELQKDIRNEAQVVYILSRIRKMLELGKHKSKYPILNFYCNWVLHSEINDTEGKSVNFMLREFIEKPEEKYKMSFHLKFQEQFKKYLDQNGLPIPSKKNMKQLRFQLQKIISDTPIFVKTGTRYKIAFREPANKDESGLHITTVVDP